MKYIKYIILSGLAGIVLWSCSEDNLGPVLHINGGPVITAPAAGALWELKDSTADQALPDITWTAADYGFEAGTSYKVEVDVAGKNFAEAVVLGIVNKESLTITQGDLNNILLSKELEGETPVDIEFRVTATVNSDVQPLVSDAVGITVIPYSANVVIPQLQVPGSYQGWAPSDSTTAVYSPKSNGLYEGYIYFGIDDAKYKYTVGPSWDTNYGDDGDNGSLDKNGADIPAGAAGVYKLNVDFNGLTHTRLRTDWGVIGSATANGWDSDQNMTYDPATKKFTATLDLSAGEIKFRANDDWAVNFGDDGNNKTLEYGAANIPVAEAGNYTIDLIIVGVAKYKYAIKKN
jgi:hypothetical protein